jgi:hypothetical protein
MCFTLRLHMSAAPPQGGLTQALGSRETIVRLIKVDGFEFGDPGSSLDLAISSPGQHPDISSFLTICGASALDGPAPPPAWEWWQNIVTQLHEFSGVQAPHPSQFRIAVLLRDDWDLREVAFSAGPHLVWYRWQTDS